MDLTSISVVIAGIFGGTTIWQFLSYKKQLRKIEAKTKIDEEEAESAEFNNYKQKIEQFLNLNAELIDTNYTVREENFNLKQKMKEYEYRFESYDRKMQGMQRTIDESIKKYNSLRSELASYQRRSDYAEKYICLQFDCKERKPDLGTFKFNSDENK